MTTKSMQTSITGVGFSGSLVALPIDKKLQKAQENGVLAETVERICRESANMNLGNIIETKNPQVVAAMEKIAAERQTKADPKKEKPKNFKDWLKKNFDFSTLVEGANIPNGLAQHLLEQAVADGAKRLTPASATTILCEVRRERRKENERKTRTLRLSRRDSETPVGVTSSKPVAEPTPAPPVVEKATETAPTALPTTIMEMIGESVAKQKQLRAKTEELLAEAARLEEEAKAEAEFEEFLKGVESLPNANAYLPKMLAHFQK